MMGAAFQNNSPYGCNESLTVTLDCATVMRITQRSFRWSALDTPQRQQYFGRCVFLTKRPTIAARLCARKRRNRDISLVVPRGTAHSWGTVSTYKGTKTCLRKLGSSQQQPHSLWQGAWKQTSSVALSAQPPVQSQLTHLAQTQPQQRLPVRPLACCVTTRASAAQRAKTSTAPDARTSSNNRRRDFPSAAILRLKDPSHV